MPRPGRSSLVVLSATPHRCRRVELPSREPVDDDLSGPYDEIKMLALAAEARKTRERIAVLANARPPQCARTSRRRPAT
jgi:hypothetical protein